MAKFCGYCGNRIDDGVMFCNSCGNKVGEQQEQPQIIKTYHNNPQPKAQPQALPQIKLKKRRGGLIAVIVILAVIAVAACTVVALFVYPGFLKPSAAEPVQPAETPVQEYTEATTAATEETVTKPETEPQTEPETEPETEPLNKIKVGKSGLSDFDWFIGAVDGGAPSYAKKLKKSGDVSGNWKGYFEFYMNSDVRYLNNVEIMAGDRAVTVKVKPQKIDYGEGFKKDSDKTRTMDGSIDSGSIDVFSTFGRLSIDEFYETGGKQYALGTFINPSGEKAYVGLVRP